MTRAIRNYNYESDDGRPYLITIERNYARAVAVNYGLPLCIESAGVILLPRYTKPRYACAHQVGNYRKKHNFIVGSLSAWRWLHRNGGGNLFTESLLEGGDSWRYDCEWVITALVGEKRTKIPQVGTTRMGLLN